MKKITTEQFFIAFAAIIMLLLCAFIVTLAYHTHDHGRCYNNPELTEENHKLWQW